MEFSDNTSIKKISFNHSKGSDEEQLNRIIKYQRDGPKRFNIEQIIPMSDVRGHDYFWIYFVGKFPEKKVWEEQEK